MILRRRCELSGVQVDGMPAFLDTPRPERRWRITVRASVHRVRHAITKDEVKGQVRIGSPDAPRVSPRKPRRRNAADAEGLDAPMFSGLFVKPPVRVSVPARHTT